MEQVQKGEAPADWGVSSLLHQTLIDIQRLDPKEVEKHVIAEKEEVGKRIAGRFTAIVKVVERTIVTEC